MIYKKIRSIVSFISLVVLLCPFYGKAENRVRPDTKWGNASLAVRSIDWDALGKDQGKVSVEALSPELCKVSVRFTLEDEVRQDNWALRVNPSFTPSFHWAPHLTPTDQHVIDQHVFRTPALLLQDRENTLVIMPDTKNNYTEGSYRIYMDLDAGRNVLSLGMSRTKVTDHVLFERQPGAVFPKGDLTFSFYVMAYRGNKEIQENPFRPILDLYWRQEGRSHYKKADLSRKLFETYCEHAYTWAFNTWKEAVWQEFPLNGKKVGAPVFIVNVTQSPNYPGEINERETRSVWNQAWFSSIRSASGLYRYARRTKNEELKQKASLAKELALSAPQKNGLFYGVIATEMEEVEIGGKKYNRSKGWDTYYWGNSNRNPVTWDLRKSPFHLLDMSWTAYYMLEWYDELEKDGRLLDYALRYGEALVRLQDQRGYYPAWIDMETGKPLPELSDSPESSMSALFLLKLYELTGKPAFRESALKALRVVTEEVVPASRWEDFETYWSCCRWGSDELPGKKVERNNTYKQCNFSMFWTADALRKAFEVTGDSIYLNQGARVLDELLMSQASWQPGYIYVDAVGGFGVLNSDGEWNDARGSLFSELLLTYGKLLGQKEYTERGLLALKTSFSMMYCPQNPRSREQWEKAWPFFSAKDYGFMMENYGHGGSTSPEGEGMGEFTIFDWGNGAAAEAYNRILDHWGEEIF